VFTVVEVRANGTYVARLIGDPDEDGPEGPDARLEWAAWLRPAVDFMRDRGGGSMVVAWPDSP
jgi:hypothetical protein